MKPRASERVVLENAKGYQADHGQGHDGKEHESQPVGFPFGLWVVEHAGPPLWVTGCGP